MMRGWLLPLALVAVSLHSPNADARVTRDARYTLRNPLEETRQGEVIELTVPAALRTARTLAAFDAESGAALPVQYPAASDRPGIALVQVDLPAHGQRRIRLSASTSANTTIAKAYGRFVPERKDDFAWENDRIAFRMYGPALAATGEISSGIDIWAKRVRGMVIDGWYARDDYHNDNGEGLDFYKVGPSRGCGGIALRDGEAFLAASNYVRWRRLANGPLRVVFELDYAPWGAPGHRVSETKRISLDAGSNLSRIESRFTPEAGSTMPPVAIGLKREDAGDRTARDANDRWALTWYAPDPKHGSIGCAAVMPANTPAAVQEGKGHVWLMPNKTSSRPLAYYAGAAWSQGLDIHDEADWKRWVADFARRLDAPIKITPGR